MSHTLHSAKQHNELYGMPPELTFELVQAYFIEKGFEVQNIALVKDFHFFLSKTDGQEHNRQLFKEFVDILTRIRLEKNGEKFLILKEEFRVKRRAKVSNAKPEPIRNRISQPNSPTTAPLIPITTKLRSTFYGEPIDEPPPLPVKQRHAAPPGRVPPAPPFAAPPLPVPQNIKQTHYPSPILPQRSEIFSMNSRTTTPTLTGVRVHELNNLMPSGLRSINNETTSINSSEPDRSSMDFSRNLEHAWVTACVTGNDEQIHRMLLEDSNFCHYQDYIYGYTGLHWASKQGHIEIIASLLMAGADVNTRSFGGHAPLHLAAQQNQEKVIEFLVNQCGADIDTRDNYGKPPSDYLPIFATKRSKYWLRKEQNNLVYSPLHCSSQPKQERKKIFSSQGELSGLERTTSRIRESFRRRKGKTLNLQRSNTVGVVNT